MSNGEQKPPVWKRDIVTLPQWMAVVLYAAMLSAIGYMWLDYGGVKEELAVLRTKMSMMEKIETRLERIDNKLDEMQKDLYRMRGTYARKTGPLTLGPYRSYNGPIPGSEYTKEGEN